MIPECPVCAYDWQTLVYGDLTDVSSFTAAGRWNRRRRGRYGSGETFASTTVAALEFTELQIRQIAFGRYPYEPYGERTDDRLDFVLRAAETAGPTAEFITITALTK